MSNKKPDNSPSDLVSEDLRCVWHPYTQMLTAPSPIPVEKAQGVYLYTADGKRILDGISSWWVNIHGHNHPRLNKALREQVSKFSHVMFAGFTHRPMVQGAGGMIVWPTEFLLRVREATRRHSIPLIADEIFTGFGRTGKMFACEHGPIEPDILCLSKALTGGYLPLAATITSDEIYRTFLGPKRDRTFFHGHSYTGNALACAVALESLPSSTTRTGCSESASWNASFGKDCSASGASPK